MNQLNFMNMVGNYEQRAVKNTRTENFIVDTAMVTDRDMPYETAISYRGFRRGEWIILGWNETKEAAKQYHDELVEFYKTHNVEYITDVYEGIDYWKDSKC